MSGLRVALCADFREEQWPSMDRVANELAAQIRRSHADAIDLTPVCPAFAKRATSVWSGHAAFSIDRALNRWWGYPHEIDRIAGRYDLFHVVDHSYAHLIHRLPYGRCVVTCHDLDTFRSVLRPAEEKRSALFRAATRCILTGLQRAAWITCDTAAVRDELLGYGLVPPQRVSVAAPGVGDGFSPDADEAGDREAARLVAAPPGAIEILHVGSTIPRKRIDTLISVCAALVPSVPDVHLVRVGGAFTPDQQRRLEASALARRVSTLGFVSERTLAAIYRRAAVVLQPSEREGFGLPVLEALASGTPVVASDLPVMREVGGAAVEYAPVADVESWVSAVRALLDERQHQQGRWHARREAGRDRARGFTWSQFASHIAGVYREIGGVSAKTRALAS